MLNLARARMGLGSFALGVACTILVQASGALERAARSLWRWAAEADLSWLLQGHLPLIAAAIVLVAVGCGVLGTAWRNSIRDDQPPAVFRPAVAVASPHAASTTTCPERRGLTGQAQAQLEQQLTDLLKLVVGYLERNNAYSAAVVRVQDQLKSDVSIEQVRRLVEILIGQNAEALRDASSLRGELEQAQRQTSNMREQLQEAERLTKLDDLTAVANRRGLEEFLESETAISHRDQSPLCVVMADIDNFKQVNDSFGHRMGDDVLRSFAQLLQSCSRSTDLVARYGGEEFALILPRTPMGNAYQITDAVRRVLDGSAMNAVGASRALVKVTASFGIAEIRDDEDATQLLFRADRMLYEAKKKGRNLITTDSLERVA